MDFSKEKFEKLVIKSLKIIEGWYQSSLRNNKIYHNYSPKEINKLFKLSDNNSKQNPEKVLSYLEKNLLKTSNFNPSPNYYGYITGVGNQIGIISEFLKSA